MKVTGGEFRGRMLRSLGGHELRPTSARVREAVFNIIGTGIKGARVLDLFAGTGIMGIEALSRGAKISVFVESYPEAVRVIRENLAKVGCLGRARIYHSDVLRGLATLHHQGQVFDFIYIDPPYKSDLYLQVVDTIGKLELLSPEGRVIIEADKRRHFPDQIGCLTSQGIYGYGDTVIKLYVQDKEGGDANGGDQ